MIFSQERALNKLDAAFNAHSPGNSPVELYEPIKYIISLGGKRLRPLLTLMAANLFSEEWDKAIKPAMAIEYFHNFTLMHDDIMDKAPLRRGKPTVHEKWNVNTAILSGDVMLVGAYDLLLESEESKLREIITAFNDCAAKVCEGQQLDMNYESTDDVSIPAYLDMIRKKTAVLLGFSLKLGGIIGGAKEKDLELLKEFGENIGLAFQLMDDLLDVYADQEKFGKKVGGDIVAKKKTYLLITALENSNEAGKKKLISLLEDQSLKEEEKVKKVKEIYDSLKIKELTEAKMSEYYNAGIQKLEKVEASLVRKSSLLRFANGLMKRES
ncbi:MAG: polyprenyl synthetase family protein [Sporocytophaga sp.]|uniref:polyprenyl synthetase family protein n=1 Tax=Sporocytophaga sp. TaxID=2231183 RepID=UPI001B25BF1C|nr:polyprenyl synthetase family protein [Sporocytophaga sp.]MBO9700055.1 polyprenyl synthetase family protein [Sporocytophaga sp.]